MRTHTWPSPASVAVRCTCGSLTSRLNFAALPSRFASTIFIAAGLACTCTPGCTTQRSALQRGSVGSSPSTSWASVAQVHVFVRHRLQAGVGQRRQRFEGVAHAARGLLLQGKQLAFFRAQPFAGAVGQHCRQALHLADRRAQLVRQLPRKGIQVEVQLLQFLGAFVDRALELLVMAQQQPLGFLACADVTADAVVADESGAAHRSAARR